MAIKYVCDECGGEIGHPAEGFDIPLHGGVSSVIGPSIDRYRITVSHSWGHPDCFVDRHLCRPCLLKMVVGIGKQAAKTLKREQPVE